MVTAKRGNRWVDLTGQRFGNYLVTGFSHATEENPRRSMWHISCDCGYATVMAASKIKRDRAGCPQCRAYGLRHPKSYAVWEGIKQRCNNPNNKSYVNYGGRGITICPEWGTFLGFLADMGDRPDGLSLDRIDNDRGYSKENCRWTTRLVQNINKRGRKGSASGIRGVWRDNRTNKWVADISFSGIKIRLGRFQHLADAAAARKAAEEKYHLPILEEGCKCL